MSSYLNIYLVPKSKGEEKQKPLLLISYSRSSDIYQYFNDNLNIAYYGMGEVPNYSKLTKEMVDNVLYDLKKDIQNSEKRVAEYEKHAAGNYEIIDEIIHTKEYIEDLKSALHPIEYIGELVSELEYSEFEAIYINID